MFPQPVETALLRPLPGSQGMAWGAGELVLKPLDMSLDALVWQEAVLSNIAEDGFRARPDAFQYLIRAAILRVVMDHLCNPQGTEPPPWWPSLLRVTAELCHLAADAQLHGA
jgi:hypothetical protein